MYSHPFFYCQVYITNSYSEMMLWVWSHNLLKQDYHRYLRLLCCLGNIKKYQLLPANFSNFHYACTASIVCNLWIGLSQLQATKQCVNK